MTTVIYRRQSLDKNADELGIDRQLNECKRVASTRSLPVAEIITDNSVTASKRGRPGYNRLVQMVGAGQVDTIIILRIDRLLRLNDELEELIKLVEQRGLKVVTVEGDIDLSTYQGRLMARILVSIARAEMEVKSARHKLANKQKAEAGKPHGARRAFGYESDGVTIKPDEAKVLNDMAYKLLSGWSFKEIAYHLNDAGITTAQGKLFYPITIRNTLQRKRYVGIREYDSVEYKAVWEPIFDAETWELLQHTMKMKSEKNGGRPTARKYLLTGFVYCGKCERPLNGATKRDHPDRPIRRTYHCRVQGDAQRAGGCGGVVRGADPLEHLVKEAIIYRLDTPGLSKLLQKAGGEQPLAPLLEQRDLLRFRLDSITDDYADGTLDKLAYKRASDRVKSRLADVEREIEQLHHQSLSISLQAGQSVREAWDQNSDGWRRQLMSLLIDRIVVNVGKTKPYYMVDGVRYRFDPELVEIIWRV